MKAGLPLVVIQFLLVPSHAAWHPGEKNLAYPVWTHKNKIPDFTTPVQDENLIINDEDKLEARITEEQHLKKHATERSRNNEKPISIVKTLHKIKETATRNDNYLEQLKNKTNTRADTLLNPTIHVTKIDDKLGQMPLLERLKARVSNSEISFTKKPVVARIDNNGENLLSGIRQRIAESLTKLKISTPAPLSLTRKIRQMDMPMFDMPSQDTPPPLNQMPTQFVQLNQMLNQDMPLNQMPAQVMQLNHDIPLNQMPAQVAPDKNSMPGLPPGLNVNAYKQCLNRCLHTQEYNPVCGSNGRLYNNLSRLRCDARCGVPVTFASYGTCAQPQRPVSSFLQSASPGRLRPGEIGPNNQQMCQNCGPPRNRLMAHQMAGGYNRPPSNTNFIVLH